MSKKTSYLLGIILTIIIGTFFYWKLCCTCNCNKKEKRNKTVLIPEPKQTILAPFGIKEVNDELLLKMGQGISFDKSNCIVTDSLSKDLNNGIIKLKEYLDANGKKRFNVTGYYNNDEENKSVYPNLGLARANSVKNHMDSVGIPTRLINTFGALNDKVDVNSKNNIYNAVNFHIVDENKANNALKQACEALKAEPLVLYFTSSQVNINLTKVQKEKLSKMYNCIDKLGANVKVTGHTDNTGNPDYNIILGQRRADFAKEYLIQNGIPSNKINTNSEGQEDPIENNATSQGRKKNRRTVITIN